MKPYLLATPLLLLALGGQTPYTFAQTPSTHSSPDTTVTKKIVLKFLSASELVYQINELQKTDMGFVKGLSQLSPQDAYQSVDVAGTAEAVAQVEQLCKILDVKPRTTKVKLRLYEIQLAEDGTEKETLIQSPTINTKNNAKSTVSYETAGQSTKLVVTPHINGDNSVTASFGVSLERSSGLAKKSVDVTATRRMTKQNEWQTVSIVPLSTPVRGGENDTTSMKRNPSDYPLYRLEASVAEVK